MRGETGMDGRSRLAVSCPPCLHVGVLKLMCCSQGGLELEANLPKEQIAQLKENDPTLTTVAL